MSTNGTNGTHPDPLAAGLAFDYARWRRLTELALAEGEKRLADTHQAIRDAQAAVVLREQELDVLRRALALVPKGPGLRTGPTPVTSPWAGIGGRAAAYLLELLRVSGQDELTRARAVLACRGWGDGTIGDGFKRLLKDGYLERVERGVYRLTEAGRHAPEVPPGMLPLTEPGKDDADGAAAPAHTAGDAGGA